MDAQKLYLVEHKNLSTYYNEKLLEVFGNDTKEKIKYSIDFKSYAQNLGLDSVSDIFYVQEKDYSRALSKETNDKSAYITYSLWKYSCIYGTDLTRWFITSASIIFVFGVLYSHFDFSFSTKELQKFCEVIKPSIEVTSVDNVFSPFYYSVVTFATLGYGDITPSDLSGQIFSVIEVLTGYLMLGGLLSVFSKKIVR